MNVVHLFNAGAAQKVTAELRERSDSFEQALQRFLQLLGAQRIRVLQLTAHLPFTETEQELGTRALVDALRYRAGVELREQTDLVRFERNTIDDMCAQRAVNRVVEVLRCELVELWLQNGMGEHARQCVALQLGARIEPSL